MARLGGASLLLILTLAAPAQADDLPAAPPVTPDALSDAARKARFTANVLEGDRARAGGRLTAAAKSYAMALEILPDALVAGRLGVILVALGQPVDAADLLLEAIQRADQATPEERHGFLTAYDAARAQVTWLDITISHAGAKLSLDTEPRNRDGFSALSMFVVPGEHELRARLDGYEDAVEAFTAIKGKRMSITLTLRALPEPLPRPLRLRRERPRLPLGSLDEPPDEEPPKREPIMGGVIGEGKKREGVRGSISAGPVVVFGVATWAPAVGAVLGGSLQVHEHVSLGLEGRAAWVTSGIGGEPIHAMTAGGLASACGHWRWLFGCALGHVGVIKVDVTAQSYKPASFVNVSPGAGGASVPRFKLHSPSGSRRQPIFSACRAA